VRLDRRPILRWLLAVLIVFSAAGLSACASDATRATGAGATVTIN
jgi:hypothetical protein